MTYRGDFYNLQKLSKGKGHWDRYDAYGWDVRGFHPQKQVSLQDYYQQAAEFQEVYDWVAELKGT